MKVFNEAILGGSVPQARRVLLKRLKQISARLRSFALSFFIN
jgi:hypothetical protein